MRLNILALSLTFGLLWGAAILFVAVANLIWPGYGRVAVVDVLNLLSSTAMPPVTKGFSRRHSTRTRGTPRGCLRHGLCGSPRSCEIPTEDSAAKLSK
jgi:hypothetical protein